MWAAFRWNKKKRSFLCLLKCYHQSSLSSSSASFSGWFSWAAGAGTGRSRRAHDMASDFFIATSILAAIMFTVLLLTSMTCKWGSGGETAEGNYAKLTVTTNSLIDNQIFFLLPTGWSSAQTPSLPQILHECWAEGQRETGILKQHIKKNTELIRWGIPHRGAVCIHVTQLRDGVFGVDGDDDLRPSLVPVEPAWCHFLTLQRC